MSVLGGRARRQGTGSRHARGDDRVRRRSGRAIIRPMQDATGYELLDIGGGGRLERFGERTVDRPAPDAPSGRGGIPRRGARPTCASIVSAGGPDPRPTPARGRSGSAGSPSNCAPTDAGQVGLFPEHEAMLSWLRRRTPGAGPQPLRLHRAGDARARRRGRVGDARRRVATDRRLGETERRTVRSGGPPGPLDRGRRSRLRRARGTSRASLRWRRARPADLRPRLGRPVVAPRGRPRRAARCAARRPRTGRLRAADRPYARRSVPTGSPTPSRTASAVVPRPSRPASSPSRRPPAIAWSSGRSPAWPAGHDAPDAIARAARADQPHQPAGRGRRGPARSARARADAGSRSSTACARSAGRSMPASRSSRCSCASRCWPARTPARPSTPWRPRDHAGHHERQPVFEKLAFGGRSEGLVAVVRIPDLSLERLALPADALVARHRGRREAGQRRRGAALGRWRRGRRRHRGLAADGPVQPQRHPGQRRDDVQRARSPRPPRTTSGPGCGSRGLRVVAARVDAARPYTDADLRGPLGDRRRGRGDRPRRRLDGPGRRAGRHPDARRGRQPERVGQRGRVALRGATATPGHAGRAD